MNQMNPTRPSANGNPHYTGMKEAEKETSQRRGSRGEMSRGVPMGVQMSTCTITHGSPTGGVIQLHIKQNIYLLLLIIHYVSGGKINHCADSFILF